MPILGTNNNRGVIFHTFKNTSFNRLPQELYIYAISKYSKYVLSNLIIKENCNYFWWSSRIPDIRVSILERRHFFIDVNFFVPYLRSFDNKWSCKMFFFLTRLHIYHFLLHHALFSSGTANNLIYKLMSIIFLGMSSLDRMARHIFNSTTYIVSKKIR